MDMSPALETCHPAAVIDQRRAPRFTSLIRAAKLLSPRGEFVCVIRDVSATGISLRAFHALPAEGPFLLELGNGRCFEIELVRGGGFEASYRFVDAVEVSELVEESWAHKRRPLRLALGMHLTIATLCGRFAAFTANLSQQGARISCGAPLALEQPVRVEAAAIPSIRAKIRWRGEGQYGLIFDDTFSLRDFALLAAAVQAPALLRPTAA